MKDIVQALEQNLKERNWYGALFIALTLPDICGKIDNPKSRSGDRYSKWFEKYICAKYTSRRIDQKDLFNNPSDWNNWKKKGARHLSQYCIRQRGQATFIRYKQFLVNNIIVTYSYVGVSVLDTFLTSFYY